jgi:serine/threonine-protein kinase
VAVCLCAAPAFAGADEKIAAEALFDEGKRLMLEGKFAAACEKLEESERVDPAIGTLLYLAECYEKSGRPASAWATFREAASAARASGQLERARVGQERAARLEPSLVKLTIMVPTEDVAIIGFTVKRSTEIIPQALWGAAVPVDPGDYSVEASAAGYEPYVRRITIGKDPLTVELPPLRALPPTSAPPPPVTAVPVAASLQQPAPPPPAADKGTGMSTLQITGLVVAGAGIISIGVGTVFGINAIAKNDDAKQYCQGKVCDNPQGEKLSNEANDAAVVANVTIGVGAAALVGGGLMYFLAPRKTSASGTGVRVVPAFSAREVGAFAEGRF